MSGRAESTERSGLDRLREHARDCSECTQAPLPLDAISRTLAADEPVLPAPAFSHRVMIAAKPLLSVRARRAYRTQLLRSLLLTLSPLPVIALFDAYMLREAYRALSGWLPAPVVAWVLVGYTAMLLLLCALTYAALPLLITPPRIPAKGSMP
jgi:hypothetical protein